MSFFPPSRFPFLRPLIEGWREARREALALRDDDLMPYPVGALYQPGKWKVCGLWAEPYPGQTASEIAPILERNRRLCPRTAAMCRDLPGSVLAAFSILEPGCEMEPHRHEQGVYIAHIGLVVPEGTGIEVDGETRHWEEGGCLVFHETSVHRSWNRGNSRRIVLLADFNPGAGG